jgi:hypothetical protein
MWIYNSDYNRWISSEDRLSIDNFEFLKQELSSYRLYSKCLSGATYLPINDFNNIYDILGSYQPRNWYVSILGSQYTNTLIPQKNASPINLTNSDDYYIKYNSEYGLTLKNLFTPDKLIKDSVKNYIYVDVASTNQIDDILDNIPNRTIDGIRLKEGQRILIKDQKSTVILSNLVDPKTYFEGSYNIVQNLGATIEYEYFNNSNGIYLYRNNILLKETDLDNYEDCVRFSVVVKLGDINREKQFHLNRLSSGYYPTSINQSIEFIEKHNWLLRNRVDYNNLFEINYYDIVKNPTQSYFLNGITYSIPERTITVGEFGIINNFQEGVSNIINNKYKVNLRSITETSIYYWICGDNGTLLRVRKHDFNIDRIELKISSRLNSCSFFGDLNGVVVGDLNTIFVTNDSGNTWDIIKVSELDSYYYYKVIFNSANTFFVIGNAGIFIEFRKDISGWKAYRKRISRFKDDDDEYILVDNINDMLLTNIDWNISYTFGTQSIPLNKDLLIMVSDDSKIIAYDINSTTKFSFIYLDFNNKYGDIINITRRQGTDTFIFTGINEQTGDSGLFSFDISNFQNLGIDNEYSNSIFSSVDPIFESSNYPNETIDYLGNELLICGNESLLLSSTYSSMFSIFDQNFENRLKSKLLVLDYDIASKLNFFRDNGEYRLPNSVDFSLPLVPGSYIEFSPIVHTASFPSFATQSEINWFEYWRDRQMTFEYYSNNPMTNTSKVLISNTFSYSTISASNSISSSNITIDPGYIINLAPTILESGHSRYNGFGLTPISAPTASFDLYLYDYLMIYRVPTTYPVSVGDLIRLESPVLSSNFSVNKILTLSGNKYIYMFTEFNEDIIRQLKSSTVTLINLNKFDTIDDLEWRFNVHDIYYGYELEKYIDNVVTGILMDFTNGGLTSSYTNWSFTSGFTSSINFPTSSALGAPLTSPPFSFITTGVGDDFIETPNIQNVTNISFSYRSANNNYNPGTTFSFIKIQGFSGSNWVDLNTYTIPNGITLPNTVNFPVIGSYSKFRFNLRTSGASPLFFSPVNYKWIGIDDILLTSNSQLIIDNNSYGIINSNINFIKVNAKFNNLTSYYNLATNIDVYGSAYSMLYTDGFMKFGYTPTYNLLDYLESINPIFSANREYLAMPDYRGIPMPGISNFTQNDIYIDYNYGGNKIIFGENLKFEWESLFINTFVDINLYNTSIYSNPNTSNDRMLIVKKTIISNFDNLGFDAYIIEFQKTIILPPGSLYYIDIISRRKLLQISNDLQYLNNIGRPQSLVQYTGGTTQSLQLWNVSYTRYERDLNFKINTDSYAKILLSDVDTIQSLSAIIYTDYKNELAMNITRLEEEISVPILNTANFLGNLFISCLEKHGLNTGDGVVLEFNGGTGSSQELNQQYFGYHSVIVVNEFNFYLDIPYGSPTIIGNDTGFVKYVKKDPFFNYQPVDIIDIGVDKMGKIAIELNIDNVELVNDVFRLVNVDLSKFRFRLIDGLNIELLADQYSWLYEAEVSGAVIGLNSEGIVWYKGIWECGRWFGGTWQSGTWQSGDWYGGVWNSKMVKDNWINVEVDNRSSDKIQSTWLGGRWYDGTWNDGTWVDGRWYGGTWNDGIWYRGIWNDGTWNAGMFNGGIWVLGTWNSGVFNSNNGPSYWLDGFWYGGDFENGMWYNGIFEQKNSESRFGSKSYNSRTATWHGGKWISGSFHSRINLNDSGNYDVSDTHKYSIWYSGQWFNGDFYGGVAYNIDFKSGTWHGGILEDIQVIGFTGSTSSSENYFVLNGIFKFNTGDEFTIIDNEIGNTYSIDFGSNDNPGRYNVLYTIEDNTNKRTNIYVDKIINYSLLTPTDLGLRVVSRFRSCDWKSGIWSNGIFESGKWQGGIWYNGVFENNGIWL